MDNKLIVLILLLFIGAIIVCTLIVSKKSYNRRKSYGKPEDPSKPNPSPNHCAQMFPPPPTETPPSAYAKLMTPYILSSSNNPNIPPTLHTDPKGGDNFYSDKYVCNTPWKMNAYNNDSCAQYGIGEMVEGPPGNQFCVCEAQHKKGGKVKPNTPMSNDIVIGVGGVCTQDSQCCTNNCTSMPGQFSKMCSCPKGQRWSIDTGKCVEEFYPSSQRYSSMYDPSVENYPAIPVGTAVTTGKLCASNAECSLGEACTPDNFCASQLIPDNERDGNKFRAGANCTNTSQCSHNLQCTNGRCVCPQPLIYEPISRTCQCADGTLAFEQGKCIPIDKVKRQMCPTLPGSFTSSIFGCGLGEKFNLSTNQCMCAADLHTKQIEYGGRCENSNQCKFGKCLTVAGVNVCMDQETSEWSLAVAEYL